jgi:hypothetical protein
MFTAVRTQEVILAVRILVKHSVEIETLPVMAARENNIPTVFHINSIHISYRYNRFATAVVKAICFGSKQTEMPVATNTRRNKFCNVENHTRFYITRGILNKKSGVLSRYTHHDAGILV